VNPPPDVYLCFRRPTDMHWSEPHPLYGDVSALGARERSRQLMHLGVSGLIRGRVTEWRLVRHGVVFDCWRTTGND
jgi:hypothetical protein